MGYPEHPRIRSSSGRLHRSLAADTHIPISRPSAGFFQVPPNQFAFTRRPGVPSFLIPKSSAGREGSGLSVSRADGRIASTMSDLASKTCVACRGGTLPLKGEELSILQKQVDGWNIIEEHHITRTFKFPDFREALKFVNRVGELAEEQGHHPDIFLAWEKVEITTWTHKINGLTG